MENLETSVEPTKQAAEPQSTQADVEQKPAKSIEQLEKELSETRKEAKERRLREKELTEKLSAFETEKAENEKRLMLEQGKFQELYEKEQSRVNELLADLEGKNVIVNKYLEYETSKRNSLLEKLPEHLREDFKELSIEKIERVVNTISQNKDPQGITANVANNNNNNFKLSGHLQYPFQGLD